MQVLHIELVKQINKIMNKKKISIISTIIVTITLVFQYLNGGGEYTNILYSLLMIILLLLVYSIIKYRKN